MFSEDKVTEIFCWADEFCKFFDAQQEKSMLDAPQDGKRYRRRAGCEELALSKLKDKKRAAEKG